MFYAWAHFSSIGVPLLFTHGVPGIVPEPLEGFAGSVLKFVARIMNSIREFSYLSGSYVVLSFSFTSSPLMSPLERLFNSRSLCTLNWNGRHSIRVTSTEAEERASRGVTVITQASPCWCSTFERNAHDGLWSRSYDGVAVDGNRTYSPLAVVRSLMRLWSYNGEPRYEIVDWDIASNFTAWLEPYGSLGFLRMSYQRCVWGWLLHMQQDMQQKPFASQTVLLPSKVSCGDLIF